MNQMAHGFLDQIMNGTTPSGTTQSQTAQNDWGISNTLSSPKALAVGGVVGGLLGMFLAGKKPKKLAKSALKIGGVALVGGLAYKAWRDWSDKKKPTSNVDLDDVKVPMGTVFVPSTDPEKEHLGRTLIRAMVTAAKADGQITDEERRRICEFFEQQNMPAGDRVWLKNELRKPIDIDAVARGATCPEVAAEIYMASLLAIDPDGRAERGYLQLLASQLRLDLDLVDHLHAQLRGRESSPLLMAAE